MIKIGLLAIVAVAITMFIKQTKAEYAYIFSLCVGVFLFMLCMDSFLNIADMIRLVSSQIENADVYIYTLLRIVGISYISEFCGEICKDAGYASIGKGVETAGKFSVLLIGMPIFLNLVDVIKEFY